MNFKTPFKVLTTAALVGALSLSAVAPGAASASEKSTQSVQAKEAADYAISQYILTKTGSAPIIISADKYQELFVDSVVSGKSFNEILNGYAANAVVTTKGAVFTLETYTEAFVDATVSGANKETEALLESLDKAGKSTEKPADLAEAKVDENGKLVEGEKVPTEETGDFKVTEIAAISAKEIKVNFNKAADNLTAADFSVKKGAVTASVASVKIADDKKSATIELAAKLTEGEYTVSVKNGEDTLTGSVKAEDEKIDKIEILSDVAPISDDAKTATTSLKAFNQYGEDVTKTATSGLQLTTNVGTADVDAKGVVTLTAAPTFKADDKVVLTVVDKTTGTSTNKTITISDKAAASEVEVGALYNKDGKTLSTDTDLDVDKFYVPVTVKDQYGNAVTNLTKAKDGITVTNTNPAVATVGTKEELTTLTIDGKETFVLPVKAVLSTGTTNVLVIANASGKNSKGTVEVAKGVQLANISLAKPEGTISAGKELLLPLTVEDTTGKAVTTKKQLDEIKDKLSTSEGEIVEVAGKGLFVKVAANKVVANTPLTVVVSTSQSLKTATQTIVPVAKATAKVITGLKADVATAVRLGKTTTIKNTDLVVEDQYGQKLSDEELKTLKFKVTTATTGDAAPFTVGSSDAAIQHVITAKDADTVKTTSDKLTFKLDGTGETDPTKFADASAFEKTFTVTKDADFASYEIKDVKPVKVTGSESTFTVDAAYGQAFVVTAKTKSGETVELDANEYNVSGDVAVASNKVKADQTIENLKASDFKDGVATKTVTVVINSTGDTLTKDITLSTAAAKAEKVQFVDSDDADKEVKEVEVLGTYNYALLTAQIVVTDQYGVTDNGLAEKATVTYKVQSGKATFSGNGTTDAKVVTAEKDAQILATIKSGDKTTTVTLKYTKSTEEAEEAAEALAEAVKAYNDAVEAAEAATVDITEFKVEDVEKATADELAAATESINKAVEDAKAAKALEEAYTAAKDGNATAAQYALIADKTVTVAQEEVLDTYLTQAKSKATLTDEVVKEAVDAIVAAKASTTVKAHQNRVVPAIKTDGSNNGTLEVVNGVVTVTGDSKGFVPAAPNTEESEGDVAYFGVHTEAPKGATTVSVLVTDNAVEAKTTKFDDLDGSGKKPAFKTDVTKAEEGFEAGYFTFIGVDTTATTTADKTVTVVWYDQDEKILSAETAGFKVVKPEA